MILILYYQACFTLRYSRDRLNALLWTSQTGEKNNNRVFRMGSDGYNQMSVHNNSSTNVLGIGIVQVRTRIEWMNGG